MTPSLQKSRHIAKATSRRRARPLVLIAEDHEDTRSLLRTMLGMSGYAISEAADGEEAVRGAKRSKPDLILMDGGLPGVDGVAATRRIRLLAHCNQIPIIFLSGHAETSFIELAREAGCDEYIVKPIDLDQLADVVKKYLKKDGQEFRQLDQEGVLDDERLTVAY